MTHALLATCSGPMLLDGGVVLMQIPGIVSQHYAAGSDGRIYSSMPVGSSRVSNGEWRPLAGCFGTGGYPSVTLFIGGKKYTRNVHRLVCSAFHGPPTHETMQVRHLDGTRTNNVPENLCWGTQYENWEDRRRHGRTRGGEEHYRSKLSNAEREHLRWAIRKGLCSSNHAAAMLAMSSSSIRKILGKDGE